MSDLPETYAEQLDRKRTSDLVREAQAAANANRTLKIVAAVWAFVLTACGIAIFVVLGACLTGGLPWLAILWPIAAASASTILAFLTSCVLGFWHGFKRSGRNDKNQFLS